MPELTEFQDAFMALLSGDRQPLGRWLCDPEALGLTVYRNTVIAGAVDALEAGYPTVVQIVGRDWFRAAATAYACEQPPVTPSLMDYGDSFADWLAAFPPASDTPYLGAIARIDRQWWEAYFAADGPCLGLSDLNGLAENELVNVALQVHPSLRLARFNFAAGSLWLAHQNHGLGDAHEVGAAPECLVIIRQGIDVAAQLIDEASSAFLSASMQGQTLLAAATLAVEADPSAKLQIILRTCFDAGAFSRLTATEPGTLS